MGRENGKTDSTMCIGLFFNADLRSPNDCKRLTATSPQK